MSIYRLFWTIKIYLFIYVRYFNNQFSMYFYSTSRLLLHAEKLSKEVNLDFQRSMNKITFDKVVLQNPKRFPFVTVEEKVEPHIPDSGRIFTGIEIMYV